MGKPIIGIPVGRHNPTPTPGEVQRPLLAVDLACHDAVVRAGATPLLLPRPEDPKAIDPLLDHVDGILLAPGGDLLSLTYGRQPHPSTCGQDPRRDRVETRCVELAKEKGLPLLGIARGMHLINAALGGTLLQDIPTQVRQPYQHHTAARDALCGHTVDIAPQSLLARILACNTLPVPSRHHQAVDEVGRGLRVNCRAKDGVVEGLESDDGHPILAVQWHPEDEEGTEGRFAGLFAWLTCEAGAYASGREAAKRRAAQESDAS